MTKTIVEAIDSARMMIRGLIYDFNSFPIGAALGRAVERGVDVAVVADDLLTLREYDSLALLVASGVAVRLDSRHNCMHQKTLIIDAARVLIGSANWTINAETSNAEILLDVQDCRHLVTEVLANWQYHFGHADPWGTVQRPRTMQRASDIARLLHPT